jgi:hypothetical protein
MAGHVIASLATMPFRQNPSPRPTVPSGHLVPRLARAVAICVAVLVLVLIGCGDRSGIVTASGIVTPPSVGAVPEVIASSAAAASFAARIAAVPAHDQPASERDHVGAHHHSALHASGVRRSDTASALLAVLALGVALLVRRDVPVGLRRDAALTPPRPTRRRSTARGPPETVAV